MVLNFQAIESLLHDCLNNQADMIVVKTKSNISLDLHAYVNDSSGPKKIDLEDKYDLIREEDFIKYLELFSFSSQDHQNAFSKYGLGEQNILMQSLDCVVIGKISSQKKAQESSFQISFIKTGINSIDNFLFSPMEISILAQKINDEGKGLVLLNNTDTFSKILINHLLNKAEFFDINTINQDHLSSYSLNKPCVLLHQFEDPIDGLLYFSEKIKKLGFLDKMLPEIRASVILKSVRKQCGNCAKPTVISNDSKQKFPLFFRDLIPNSYQFSRGCGNCGYTSYKGLTFIESVFTISEQLKSSFRLNIDPNIAYQNFTQGKQSSLFFNAINQIIDGKISIEEATKALPPISNAYQDYLELSKDNVKLDSKKSDIQTLENNKKSILIVEDDENQREILKIVFSNEGFEVLTAQNGKEALSLISKEQVSVILSDLMMPEMNGLELLRYCKKDNVLRSIPVILLTASSNPDHELKLLEEGADDYCPKNVKKKVLIKRVEKLIERIASKNNPVSHFLDE